MANWIRRKGNNVLGKSRSLTQSSYRQAVREIVLDMGKDETDQDIAERLGCSAATVGNARNKKGNLNAITLLKIAKEYKPATLDRVTELIGAKLVPLDGSHVADRTLPCIVTRFLLELSIALEDGKLDPAELAKMRPQVEALGDAIDGLRERLKVRAA